VGRRHTGSPHQAIIDANGSAGGDTIIFAHGVAGTVSLASALPLTSRSPSADISKWKMEEV
jgi:hypothetical protein